MFCLLIQLAHRDTRIYTVYPTPKTDLDFKSIRKNKKEKKTFQIKT